MLEPGHRKALKLRGPAGHLDLVAGCLATGTRRGLEVGPDTSEQAPPLHRQREVSVNKLGRLVSTSSALALAPADWNFAPSRADRWCRRSGEFSGERDSSEQAHWRGCTSCTSPRLPIAAPCPWPASTVCTRTRRSRTSWTNTSTQLPCRRANNRSTAPPRLRPAVFGVPRQEPAYHPGQSFDRPTVAA